MKRNSILAIAVIALLILSACAQTIPKSKCKLYINQQTNQVNCFRENQQPSNWLPYQKPEMGIPYACFEAENQSCELAQ